MKTPPRSDQRLRVIEGIALIFHIVFKYLNRKFLALSKFPRTMCMKLSSFQHFWKYLPDRILLCRWVSAMYLLHYINEGFSQLFLSQCGLGLQWSRTGIAFFRAPRHSASPNDVFAQL